jgi:hypothetical protein
MRSNHAAASNNSQHEEENSHFTPYSASIFSASLRAFLLLLYQIATFAPASANACATANPIPAPAPETMAVRPLREKRGSTWSVVGAVVLPWVKFPPFMAPSAILTVELWNARWLGRSRIEEGGCGDRLGDELLTVKNVGREADEKSLAGRHALFETCSRRNSLLAFEGILVILKP